MNPILFLFLLFLVFAVWVYLTMGFYYVTRYNENNTDDIPTYIKTSFKLLFCWPWVVDK